MTYLLDTNTCIRYLNGRAPKVVARLRATQPGEIVVCSVVKAELFAGAAKSATLVTHNTREFSRVHGLVYEDWEA